MAKLALVLDTRSGKDNIYPLKLRVAHKKATAYISLDVRLTPGQWDVEDDKVINHERAKMLNSYISNRRALAEAVLLKLELAGKVEGATATELRDLINNDGVVKEEDTRTNFVEFFQRCIESKKTRKTRLSYESSLKRMREHDLLLHEKTFEDIDEKYIRRLDESWESRGLTTNSRAVYFRNIRSVFNDAIDEELTNNYPFRRFSIKKAPTRKRNLSIEELRMLRDYPIVNDFQRKYRDIFMLMFYLRGINAVDLFALTTRDVRLGRINYIRSKTGKYYSVKIEPEAQAILDRYKGKDYLLDVCDGARTREEFEVKYEGFLQRMDRGLKKIGPYERKGLGGKKHIDPILPFVSQYWCRHTSATLMARMGVPNEIIALSLGHEHGNKTTNIYIEYNEEEIDVANRKLIDLVNEEIWSEGK